MGRLITEIASIYVQYRMITRTDPLISVWVATSKRGNTIKRTFLIENEGT